MERGEKESLLSVSGITKSFGKKTILSKTDFEIKEGEIVGFTGPSGSGKSVFLKIILGFIKPNEGRINKKRGLITGFSLQENPLYDYLTVEQNLQYFAKINNIKRKERRERIDRLLKELNIEEYKKTLFKKLSGGTKKRVDLACSLLEDPEVLILDEPFLGLDPGLVRQLGNFIKHIKDSGVSIIISSHRTEELSRLCDRFVSLENKKVVRTKN